MPESPAEKYRHSIQFDIGGQAGDFDPAAHYFTGTSPAYIQVHIEPVPDMGTVKLGILADHDVFCFVQPKQARSLAADILRCADEVEGR